MNNIKELFAETCRLYNKRASHYGACYALVLAAHDKLFSETEYAVFGNYAGNPVVSYNTFAIHDKTGTAYSRPIRPDIFIADREGLRRQHEEFMDVLQKPASSWTIGEADLANRIVYTSVMSVSCAYDLWQRGSRKTPGTFFEVLMAGLLLQMLPKATFAKSIPLWVWDNGRYEGKAQTGRTADERPRPPCHAALAQGTAGESRLSA